MDGDDATVAQGKSHVVLHWQASNAITLHLNGIARYEDDDSRGDAAGIAEAYVQAELERSSRSRLRARVGAFFIPTSRENVDEGWTSPYTITFSALNSWIGEELRPIGLDLEQSWSPSANDRLSFAETLFAGNDTLGTLLAWRGWSMHDRVTVVGERLPLPPLRSFETTFADQRRDGTRPIGTDLDGKIGWSARGRWANGERLVLQIAHVNNETDRDLHNGEYAWETRFTTWGGEVNVGGATLIVEYLFGSTGMGFAPRFVQLDYDASYVLLSWKRNPWRVSARYDAFGASDQDASAAESNDDDGEAWTVAAFWEPGRRYRFGVEYLDLDATRHAAVESGFQNETGGRSLRLEARLRF